MKLVKIGLTIITSLALMLSVCLPVQASEESDDVDLEATVPLTISDISASSIGYHSATISWKTNGDATSQVFYDTVYHENIGDYAYHTDVEITLVTEHSVRLTGLSSRTTYHYRVRSTIPDTEFIVISEDYTFRTSSPAPPGPAPPIEEEEPEEPEEPTGPTEPEEPELVEPEREEPEVVEPEEEPTPPEEEPEVIEPEVVEPEEEEEPYVPPAKPGTPWALIGGVVGGLAAAGGIGYWLWRRRRKEANYA
ncbi:hypothetical protein ES703_42475 [subsurface metagenome]